MKKLLVFLLAFLLLLAWTGGASAKKVRYRLFIVNGDTWLKMNKHAKWSYVDGYWRGNKQGIEWGISFCGKKAKPSVWEIKYKFTKGLTFKKLVARLDSFYRDGRNRKVRVSYAIKYHFLKNYGVSQAKLNQLLQKWRK